MFKDVLRHANLDAFATWGLVIFVAVFVGSAVWAFTRSRGEVNRWSRLPLDDRPDPPAGDAAA